MNRTALLIVIGLVVVAGIIAGGLYFSNKGSAPTQSQGTSTNPFGSLGGTTGTTGGTVGAPAAPTSGTPAATITVTGKDGSVVAVPDFTKGPQLPSASPSNGYQVAGDPDASTVGYDISYFPNQSYFNIALLAEPLGANRLKAEQALRSKLGLTDAQLCSLNIQVWATGEASDRYSGGNLGLSFCPGATQLP